MFLQHDSRISPIKIRSLSRAISALAFSIVWLIATSQPTLAQPPFVERVTPIGAVPDGWTIVKDTYIASPDSTKLALRINLDTVSRQAIMTNDWIGKAYPIAYGPTFSPDSQHIAATFSTGGRGVLELDGQTILTQDPASPPIFSPNGKRTAFIGRDGKSRFVVMDGKPEAIYYDEILSNSIVFSPDSRQLAYAARRGDVWFIVLNGLEGTGYREVGVPVFSPDSQRIAYWFKRSTGAWTIVLDGQERIQATADRQGGLVFSPDSTHLAAIARRGKNWQVILDDQAQSKHDAIGANSLTFSPDSSHLVYAVMDDKRWKIIQDGEEYGGYDAILDGSIKFSPDSSRLTYAIKSPSGWHVVLDNQYDRPFVRISAQSMRFSPSSTRFAYVAQDQSGFANVIVDGHRWSVSHGIEDLAFSPDSASVVWIERHRYQSRLVVDGVRGSYGFSQLVPGASLVFDAPDKLHTLVMLRPGPLFFRLDAKLQEWRTDPGQYVNR